MERISSNLKVLRELKKLSQEQMAEQLNITRARLGAYEEGRNEPPIDIILRIADYFKISIDALLKGDFNRAAFLAKQGTELGNQLSDALLAEAKKELA